MAKHSWRHSAAASPARTVEQVQPQLESRHAPAARVAQRARCHYRRRPQRQLLGCARQVSTSVHSQAQRSRVPQHTGLAQRRRHHGA